MSDTTRFSLSDGTLVRAGNPFFITGSGRCGTTLMRRLVIERTHAVIPPENYTLASSSRIMARSGADWDRFCQLILNDLQKYSESWEYFGIEEATALNLLTSIPGDFRNIANFWHAFHAVYANRVHKPSDTRWGDKTPSNTAELPEVIGIFPQARFVFMVRDVFDMAYSYGSMPVRAGQYLGAARRWVHANSRILDFQEQYPRQAIVVRYEDLTRFPDREMQQVLCHLDVPLFTAGALNALEAWDIAARPHLGNVLGGVSSDFIGKGRANLKDDVKQEISGIAAPLQIRLGYEPTGAAGFPLMQQ
jgi:protein-tyrosine sulfotransferase